MVLVVDEQNVMFLFAIIGEIIRDDIYDLYIYIYKQRNNNNNKKTLTQLCIHTLY